jgi:hypothetical protein
MTGSGTNSVMPRGGTVRTGGSPGFVMAMRVLSALLLLAVAGIHLYLRFDGVGGVLGVLFVLQSAGAIVLAIAVLALRGTLLTIAVGLSLLFLIGSLAALLLALTVGLFGITEVWTFTLVPQTVIVESVGIVVLAVTTAVVMRRPRATQTAA